MRDSRMKRILLNTFLHLPYPISSFVYRLGARMLYKDEREPYLEEIFADVVDSDVQGDYLEFGVFRGRSFILATQLASKYSMDQMRFFAFDSFAGLPHSEGETFDTGNYACSEALFKKMLYKAGVNAETTRVIKGFYSDSLTDVVRKQHDLVKASIVHIDCDLYSSTKCVLNFIEELVDEGTVLIFDDWYSFRDEDLDNMGERKAFREWSLYDQFEEFHELPPSSKSFIMRQSGAKPASFTASRIVHSQRCGSSG